METELFKKQLIDEHIKEGGKIFEIIHDNLTEYNFFVKIVSGYKFLYYLNGEIVVRINKTLFNNIDVTSGLYENNFLYFETGFHNMTENVWNEYFNLILGLMEYRTKYKYSFDFVKKQQDNFLARKKLEIGKLE